MTALSIRYEKRYLKWELKTNGTKSLTGKGKIPARSCDSALTLTADPDKAEYALILNMNYADKIGSYSFVKGGYQIPVYFAALTAELLNLSAKESLGSKTIYGGPYIIIDNQSYIEEDELDRAKNAGKLYGHIPTLKTDDFEGYWNFIGLPED